MTHFQLLSVKAVRLPTGIVGNAVLIDGGNVVAIGDDAELRSRIPAGADVTEVDYPDSFAIPGLRDSHIHPVAYTALLLGASLHQASSILDVQQMLRQAAADRPGLVTGWNFNEATLAEARLPVAADLDAAAPERPMMVHRYDGHMAIVNSVVLEAAGISASTPDPDGGVIDRDSSGMPTGVLRETAIDLAVMAPGMQSPVDPGTVATKMRGLAQLGITSVGAMIRSGDGAWAHLGDEAAIVAAAAADIPIRVNAFVTADSPATLETAAAALDGAGELIRWAGVKRFGDGSFGSHTAAMLEPFADSPGNRGTLRLNEADKAMARIAVAAGRRVAIHAIGDAAAARVLELFEQLVNEGARPDRLRMEHASVMRAGDIARMGRLGLVASVQPAFLGSEAEWIENRVGSERLERTYAFASLLAAGVLVVGGSDSPVEAPDPWEAMALCRDRAGVVPAEAVTPEQALAMYTTDAARALGEPEPLAVGSPADLVIVDRDPIASTPDELRATEVMDTYVAGNRVDATGTGRWWID